ncbi:MAG: phage holin family protein [Actinobacteria bacterium]|nr:phage holin family protein [Actinomycetota bacterium]
MLLTFSVWLADLVVSGIDIGSGFWSHLWVAALFGLANALIGNLIRLVAFPALLLTLGAFSIVVNAWMLMLVANLSESLNVTGFWSALLGGLIISVVSTLVKGRTKGD